MMAMWWRLTALGLMGTLSMALVSFEQLGPAPIDPLLVRALAVIQPTIFVMLCAALGLWAAPKVELDAPVVRAWAERRPLWPTLRPQLAPGLMGGIAIAALLVAFWMAVRAQPFATPILAFEMPLVTKLLYGGIVEELLLRWGLMSLFVWAAWRLGGAKDVVQPWTVWAGLIASSLLFAAGHLPVLHALLPDPPGWFVGLVLGANFISGLLFGWLFWRRGLEAAMLAHALAHLFAAVALAVR
ncbi:MAG: CPBP family glutamic-type intramembrane protease [Sphingosinicella sp.]|uniref:CPBP family glutamic-type intramembrane protease n=1 Tax=Sphingosinicella sp. TaxID=1917971 RepID=UPI0040378677